MKWFFSLVLAVLIFGFAFSTPALAETTSCNGQTSQPAAEVYCKSDTNKCTGATWKSATDCVCTGCPTNNSNGGGTVTIGPPYGGEGPQNINQLVANITTWVLGIAGAIAVLFIIIAGLRYITSHGDSKQAEAAKTTLRNAIIGLVIIVLAFFIVNLIIAVLAKTY